MKLSTFENGDYNFQFNKQGNIGLWLMKNNYKSYSWSESCWPMVNEE